MAQLKEILEIEKKREEGGQYSTIYLFPEGTFYRAYEWSAWLCCRYINQFRTTKRYNKSVSADMVFVGFPKVSLAKFTPENVVPNEVSVYCIRRVADANSFCSPLGGGRFPRSVGGTLRVRYA